MANDQQIAVKKRLIYAEDLFEPVDYKVFMASVGGRSGGKTMAMYEQLFRKRVELAPTIDPVHAAGACRCHECQQSYESKSSSTGWKCKGWGAYDIDCECDPNGFCHKGERRNENV